MSEDTSKPAKTAKKSKTLVPWGPASAVVATIVAYLVSQFVVALVFGIFFAVSGWTDAEIDTWLDSTSGQFLIMFTSAVMALMVVWLFLDIKRASWRTLGFWRRPKRNDALYVVLGFVGYFALFVMANFIAGQFFGVDTEQEQDIGFEQASSTAQLAFVFVSLVILPPFVEEMLFRGLLFGGLRNKMTFAAATLLTSALFAAPHLLGSSSGLLWIAAVDTFVLSLMLCYVREKTGALWASIGIHAIKNGLAFIYLFVVQ